MTSEPEVSKPPRFANYLRDIPERGHTTDQVVHILREAILDGVLPPLYWLRESELAQELSVSRTPVREALRRLSAEGLVTITANQGTMVTPMTIEDILEVYVVRENLEGLAARLAAKHRSQQHLDQLARVLAQMREAAAEERHTELEKLNLIFHKVIREASSNRYLDRFLMQIEHAVRRFGRTTLELPGRSKEALEEHYRIMQAIASGDDKVAESSAIEHMRRARELRIRRLID